MAASIRQRIIWETSDPQPPPSTSSVGRKAKDTRKLESALGNIFWVVTTASFFIAYWYIHYNTHRLPTAKTSTNAHADDFLEENARRHLENLCAVGVKHVGALSNEILAPRYILGELEAIKRRSESAHIIDIDEQTPSGCFYLEFLGRFVNCYYNITNVVARISPKAGSEHSILVNCHYDSSISSPGASDDVISCSMMLEILRVMSQSRSPFRHSIIFLFNGAEESILQGSHGFITQHKWVKGIQAFINLEAAGSGGRELVFQTGPENPWLISAYAKSVPHPSASVMGQEIFQSGVIPSDTDFRIYRDVGGLPGIDVAYIYNGYIYHTKYDAPQYVPPGCMQRGGENLLALLRTLAHSDDVVDPGSYRHGSMVFFDVMGFFMVIYPERLGEVLNYFVALCVLLSTSRRLLRSPATAAAASGLTSYGWGYAQQLASAWALHVAAAVAALGTAAAVAAVLTVVRPQCWYTNVWLIVPLYALPAVCSWAACHRVLGKRLFSPALGAPQREEVVFRAAVLVWTALLLLLTFYRLASAFVPMLLVAFPLFIRLLPAHFNKMPRADSRHVRTATVTLVASVLPALVILYQFYGAFIMFVPLTGRSGSEVVPDLVIGLLVAVVVVICSLCLASLLHVSRDLKKLLTCGYALSGVVFLVAMSTPIGFPYSSDISSPSPQRHVLQHLHRQFFNKQGQMVKEDSGLFYLPFDYNGLRTLTTAIPEFKDLRRSECDASAAYCGWPYYFPMIHLLRKVYYMPLPHPNFKSGVKAQLERREKLSASRHRLHFTCTGHVHLNIYIAAKPSVELRSWSFLDHLGPPTVMTPEASDRSHYFVYNVAAKEPHTEFNFWIELEVIVNDSAAQEEPALVDIGFGVHYLNGPDSMTLPLQGLLSRFPEWTAPIAWAVSYQAFEF